MKGADYKYERIRKLREQAGESQEQLAVAVGATVMTIWRVETGRNASLEIIKRIAAHYRVTYKSLLIEQAAPLASQKILPAAIT